MTTIKPLVTDTRAPQGYVELREPLSYLDRGTPMVKPHDHDESWDESDVRELIRLLHDKQNLTHQEIAYSMGRTKGGVRSKVYRLRKAGDL
jgi:hypothetical protein